MTQIIAITPEELRTIMREEILKAQGAFVPTHFLELEKLKRKAYLTEGEVEDLFGLKKTTLRKRRLTGDGPSYTKDGGRVLYSRVVVEQYLEARRQKTHDQP